MRSGETTAQRCNVDGVAAVRKVTVLDAQWSDCPVEVEAEVKDLWMLHELGNDVYIHRTTIHELETEYVDAKVKRFDETIYRWVEGPMITTEIVSYLRECGVDDKEIVWIRWWW